MQPADLSAGFEGPPKAPAPAAGEQEPAALLERLKDRDAEFDNRSVETEQRWVEKVSPRGQIAANRFDARRFGQPDPGSPPRTRSRRTSTSRIACGGS